MSVFLTVTETQKVNISSNCSFDMGLITEKSSSLKAFILSKTVQLLLFICSRRP